MDFIEREAEESEEEFGCPEDTEKKALKHAAANDGNLFIVQHVNHLDFISKMPLDRGTSSQLP